MAFLFAMGALVPAADGGIPVIYETTDVMQETSTFYLVHIENPDGSGTYIHYLYSSSANFKSQAFSTMKGLTEYSSLASLLPAAASDTKAAYFKSNFSLGGKDWTTVDWTKIMKVLDDFFGGSSKYGYSSESAINAKITTKTHYAAIEGSMSTEYKYIDGIYTEVNYITNVYHEIIIKEFTAKLTGAPINVTDITGVPTTAVAETPLTLSGTVVPANADKKTITWSVKEAGTTGATVAGNKLSTTGAGTTVITATIKDGKGTGVDFTKDFSITVKEKGSVIDPFVAVTNITGVPATATAGTVLTLTGTPAPSDATNNTISWSVKSPGTTGATIDGNKLSTTAAGTVVVTATVANGAAAGTPFVKDFTITVNTSSTGDDPGGGDNESGSGSNIAVWVAAIAVIGALVAGVAFFMFRKGI